MGATVGSDAWQLTIDLQQGMQETISLVLQGIVSPQRDREVTVGLLVTDKHLYICKNKNGNELVTS